MSRDGYLPPGCTEKDVDMAAPGDDKQLRMEHEMKAQSYSSEIESPTELADPPGFDAHIIETSVERMLAKGQKAELMEVLGRLIREHGLDRF